MYRCAYDFTTAQGTRFREHGHHDTQNVPTKKMIEATLTGGLAAGVSLPTRAHSLATAYYYLACQIASNVSTHLKLVVKCAC